MQAQPSGFLTTDDLSARIKYNNRKRQQKTIERIEAEIVVGTFYFAKTFGKSLSASTDTDFEANDSGALTPVKPLQAAQAVGFNGQSVETLTMGEFANRWYSENEITCACIRYRESATALRPIFHRIDGHRLHLPDRQIFQLDHDGPRTNKRKLYAQVARLLRKLHAQPNCRKVRIPTVVRPRPEFDSSPLTLVEQSASALMEGPLDIWSAVQDLWHRLGVICPVKVAVFDDGFELVFADALALDWDQDSVDLIARVLDPRSYHWHQEGLQGHLALCVEMNGNDLVVLSTSLEQISRWPDGQEIVGLMKCYLMQTRNTLNEAGKFAADTPLNFTTNILKGQPT